MAFVAGKFNASYSLRARAQGFQRWKYDGDTDTVATMAAADYFLTKFLELSVGDFIDVVYTNGSIVFEVLTSAVGGVTVTVRGQNGLLSAGGAALTLTEALHAGLTIINDQTAGLALTMPASTGNGAIYRVVNGAVSGSNTNTITCAGSDVFNGSIMVGLSLAQTALFQSDGSDTIITQNRTTTGLGDIGDWVEIQDILVGTFACKGQFAASGSVATPFS